MGGVSKPNSNITGEEKSHNGFGDLLASVSECDGLTGGWKLDHMLHVVVDYIKCEEKQ